MPTKIEPGVIIQITDKSHPWFSVLLIVDEVKSWGVQAYVSVPNSNDSSEPPSLAFNRLKTGEFEPVGVAWVMGAFYGL